MKKLLIIAFVTLVIVIPNVGCGGGSEETSSTDTQKTATDDSATSTAAPTTTTATTTSTSSNTATERANVPRALQYTANSLPQDFEQAVDDGFVVVVAFYDPEEVISVKVADAVEEVVEAPDYKDQIQYFSYEIYGKTSSPAAKLITTLGAKFLPHVTIINGDKEIVFEDSGFSETDYIEHALYNAVYKDRSPQ